MKNNALQIFVAALILAAPGCTEPEPTGPISTDIHWWMDLANRKLLSGDLDGFARQISAAHLRRLGPTQNPTQLVACTGVAAAAFTLTIGHSQHKHPFMTSSSSYNTPLGQAASKTPPDKVTSSLRRAITLQEQFVIGRNAMLRQDPSAPSPTGKPVFRTERWIAPREVNKEDLRQALAQPIEHPYFKVMVTLAQFFAGTKESADLRKVYQKTKHTVWSAYLLSELIHSELATPEEKSFAKAEAARQLREYPFSPPWVALGRGRDLINVFSMEGVRKTRKVPGF